MPASATVTAYRTHVFYADSECSGTVQSVYMSEDSDCASSIDGYTACMTSGYEGYYVKEMCTTDRAAKIRSLFSGEKFVAFSVSDSMTCDSDLYQFTLAFLASGTCKPAYMHGGYIATIDDQGITTLEAFELSSTCSGDSYTLVLDGDYMADPYCAGYSYSGYSFIPMTESTSTSSTTSSASDLGVVASVYEDSECSTPGTSVYITRHPTCSDAYPTSTCVQSYAGNREVFVKMECMDKWSNVNARMEVFNTAFGTDTYLAFDALSTSCDHLDSATVEYTYGYLADGLCHDAFNHESTSITIGSGGSAVMQRASRVQGDNDCEVLASKTSISSDDIATLSCVISNGSALVFYTTSDLSSSLTESSTASSGVTTSTDTTTSSSASAQSSGYQTDASSQQTDTFGGENNSSSGGSGGNVIGIVAGIGGGVLLALLIIVLFVWCRRRSPNTNYQSPATLEESYVAPPQTRKAHSSIQDRYRESNVQSGHQHTMATASSSSSHHNARASELWEDQVIIGACVPREKVVFADAISHGGFGEVYVGSFNSQRVAIKMLLPEMRRDLSQVNAFLAEAKLMATLEHPCIVRFIGVAWDSLNDVCVRSEFMPNGDLRTLLTNYEASNQPAGFDIDKLVIAHDMAQAPTYLHSLSPVVIHRDLKSRNVLLDENNAKITDFGVSRERAERTMTAGVGTSLWMAPEVMMGDRYDEKADIFSFGVVLSEIDTHALPYSHTSQPHARVLQLVTMGQLQVRFSTNHRSKASVGAAELGIACVALDPSARSIAAEATYRLHRLIREAQQVSY